MVHRDCGWTNLTSALTPERPADRDHHQQSPGIQGSARHRPEPAPAKAGGEKHPRWRPMGKSVEHFWRYAQVAGAANRRLLDALATAPLTGEATQELDKLCRSRDHGATRVARFNP